MSKPSPTGPYKEREPEGGNKGGGGKVETNHDICPLCGDDIGGEGLGNHLGRTCSVINDTNHTE